MVTQVQSNLIELLKSLGLDRETTVAIVTLCETDENRAKMINSIIEIYDQKGTVTEQEIQMIGLMLTGERKSSNTDSTTTETK